MNQLLNRRLPSAKGSFSVGIIGVPFFKGQTKSGVENAPDRMRKAGLVKKLRSIQGDRANVVDYGNLGYQTENVAEVKNMKNFGDIFACNKILSKVTKNVIQKNEKALVIGGDHSIALGSVAGNLSCNSKLGLIWIDAHADINLNTTSTSGNVHGMPVSLLISELKDFWTFQHTFGWITNRIPANKIVYIAPRDVEEYENYLINKLGIHMFGMNVIKKYGVNNVVKTALQRIDPEQDHRYHISFDIDALDPRVAPSTGTPVQDGLSLEEGTQIMKVISETGRISAVDLVEINPSIGTERDVQRTIDCGLKLITAAFGS